MPVPAFTIDGILPPFIGSSPAGPQNDMSPYAVTADDVVSTLGTSQDRVTILRNWLAHREDLRKLGFGKGFQWLDGSFVEDKPPSDLDVVTFFHRPFRTNKQDLENMIIAHPDVFQRTPVKLKYKLDTFFIDFGGTPEVTISVSSYLLNLFSHRRSDHLWKGMLRVDLEDTQDDAAAKVALDAKEAALAVAAAALIGANP